MKKRIVYALAFAVGLLGTASMTSCSDDDNDNKVRNQSASSAADSLDYAQDNATNWGKYMQVVATYLKSDATTLYNDWSSSYEGGISYAANFKSAGVAGSTFGSAAAATEQIIDGCIDIATEVGEAKIGDPLALYNQGKTKEALYAVESWYSWHSRVDYSNNIYSIRNAYYGSRDGSVAVNSIYNAMKVVNAAVAEDVNAKINDAVQAILAIPQPFRNNINSTEAGKAQIACAALVDALNSLRANIESVESSTLSQINSDYVDNVVLPTYKELMDNNVKLLSAVNSFVASPSNAGFEALADAWVAAREPWEKSEAFLFGPVADKGIDPNMDSWPLSQDDIVNILKNGNFSSLDWTGDFTEEGSAGEAIATAQSTRGFHTLEFLIYKDGKPRTIK